MAPIMDRDDRTEEQMFSRNIILPDCCVDNAAVPLCLSVCGDKHLSVAITTARNK